MTSKFEHYMNGPLGAAAYGRGETAQGVPPEETPAVHEVPRVPHFAVQAEQHIFEYVKAKLEKTDSHVNFTQEDVYAVWFCKTLENKKAMVSTTLPDGMYYEVTFNGNKGEVYIDAYKKWDNVAVADPYAPVKE